MEGVIPMRRLNFNDPPPPADQQKMLMIKVRLTTKQAIDRARPRSVTVSEWVERAILERIEREKML